MAFIPKNAKWYLADIVMETSIEDDPENIIYINITLIRADSPEEAYERALECGKESEFVDMNTDGKKMTITFRGLRDLNVIHEELEHGSELVYEQKEGLSEKQLQKLVRPKEKLAIFRPRSDYD